VLSHTEAVGYIENDKDVQTVSELMDEIRDAVADYQVSSNLRQHLCASSFKQNWSRWKTNRPCMIKISN